MKALRDVLDKVHPLFAKGGILEVAYPMYEALDTFLYTPGEVASDDEFDRYDLASSAKHHSPFALRVVRFVKIWNFTRGRCNQMIMNDSQITDEIEPLATDSR